MVEIERLSEENRPKQDLDKDASKIAQLIDGASLVWLCLKINILYYKCITDQFVWFFGSYNNSYPDGGVYC